MFGLQAVWLQLCYPANSIVVNINRSLLSEDKFVKQVAWYLVKKLVSTDKGSEKVLQLLEGLSSLCICKGDPLKGNQSK